jgi:hypothetical protein
MTNFGETCAATKNSVQVNNYKIYRAPKVGKLDRSLKFTVTRGNVNENQTRSDQRGKEHFEMLHPLPERIFVPMSNAVTS